MVTARIRGGDVIEVPDGDGCVLNELEPAAHAGPAALSYYIHVGDHVFDVRDIEKIYVPERMVTLRGAAFGFDLKTDAEMQALLQFMATCGMHRASVES